jgi:hypothetical protein
MTPAGDDREPSTPTIVRDAFDRTLACRVWIPEHWRRLDADPRLVARLGAGRVLAAFAPSGGLVPPFAVISVAQMPFDVQLDEWCLHCAGLDGTDGARIHQSTPGRVELCRVPGVAPTTADCVATAALARTAVQDGARVVQLSVFARSDSPGRREPATRVRFDLLTEGPLRAERWRRYTFGVEPRLMLELPASWRVQGEPQDDGVAVLAWIEQEGLPTSAYVLVRLAARDKPVDAAAHVRRVAAIVWRAGGLLLTPLAADPGGAGWAGSAQMADGRKHDVRTRLVRLAGRALDVVMIAAAAPECRIDWLRARRVLDEVAAEARVEV